MTTLPSKTLFVFQTSRRLQNFLADNQNTFLHASNLSDFIDKSALVDAKAKVSHSARLSVLRRAAQRIDMGRLGFERSFLDFLSHSDFLFSFFEELRAERKSIDDIRGEDIYAAFEDHLGVLEELFGEYKKELDALGAYDFISVDGWRINASYLQNFDEIVIESMGLFTAFELFVLEEAAKITPLKLHFSLDRYNKKMAKKFSSIGVDVGEAEGVLLIDVSAKKLISATPTPLQALKTRAYRLKNRAYEAPFAMSMIAEFIEAGYEAERIAVVLPDEGYAQMLRLFDRQTNLNFAFGEPLSKTKIYGAFNTLLSYAAGEKVYQKVESMGLCELCEPFASLSELSGVEPFVQATTEFLSSPLWNAKVYEAAKEIFRRALYDFSQEGVFYEDLRCVEVGYIFASAVAVKKIDDIGGGRIKTIGVLESRGADIDAVVVLDMNEEFFPKKIDKDLFLNTKIKERAGMPTVEDRQNLQKHFFYEMMRSVKECVFAFVENDEAAPSPFLFELGLEFVDVDEEALGALYFENKERAKEEPISYDGTKSLYAHYLTARGKKAVSVSAFCDYLKCDKLFYFKYAMGLKKEELEQRDETPQEIGNALHKAFELAFDPKNRRLFQSAEELHTFVHDEAVKEAPQLAEKFEFLFALRQMERFFDEEITRGHKVYAVELPVEGEIGGVAFEGRIDRIDAGEEGYSLIDYKVSRTEIKAESEKTAADSHKYQLALYAALLANKGTAVETAYYYDVLRGVLVPERALETKLESLPTHIERFLAKPTFEGTKDKKNCRYCDYAVICGVHADAVEEESGDE